MKKTLNFIVLIFLLSCTDHKSRDIEEMREKQSIVDLNISPIVQFSVKDHKVLDVLKDYVKENNSKEKRVYCLIISNVEKQVKLIITEVPSDATQLIIENRPDDFFYRDNNLFFVFTGLNKAFSKDTLYDNKLNSLLTAYFGKETKYASSTFEPRVWEIVLDDTLVINRDGIKDPFAPPIVESIKFLPSN